MALARLEKEPHEDDFFMPPCEWPLLPDASRCSSGSDNSSSKLCTDQNSVKFWSMAAY